MAHFKASTATSLAHNVVANYLAQIYVMGVGIVMAPIYLAHMGREAYGLIGFFTMLAGWFQLLDVGLTPTLSRETARFRAGAIDINHLRHFLRSLEMIFGVTALLGSVIIVLSARFLAAHWLKVQQEPIREVEEAITLMGLAVPMRWVASLYRSVINGFERQVWLGAYNVFIATLRFLGVLAVFAFISTSAVSFFAYQLVVAFVEVVGLIFLTYGMVERGEVPARKFSWGPLRQSVKFSLAVAFATTVWVVMTQADKLILSKILPLTDFGTFSLALVGAGAVYALSSPISQAVLPRLTKLTAQLGSQEAAEFYSRATQATCVLAAPVVGLLVFFSRPILFAWTAKPEIATQAAPILSLYAFGNGCVLLSSFPYFIQYAKGDLKLQFVGQALMVTVLLPLIAVTAKYYGGIGTGAAWAAVNGIYFFAWSPVVHARVYRGKHWRWLLEDVLAIVMPTAIVAWGLSSVVHYPVTRLPLAMVIALIGMVLLAISAACSSVLRAKFSGIFRNGKYSL
jgi:O-antigen/teichoic acid export membrane protein